MTRSPALRNPVLLGNTKTVSIVFCFTISLNLCAYPYSSCFSKGIRVGAPYSAESLLDSYYAILRCAASKSKVAIVGCPVRIYKLGILVSCAFQVYLSRRLVVLALKWRGGGELVKTDERIFYTHLEMQFSVAKDGIDQAMLEKSLHLPNLIVFWEACVFACVVDQIIDVVDCGIKIMLVVKLTMSWNWCLTNNGWCLEKSPKLWLDRDVEVQMFSRISLL